MNAYYLFLSASSTATEHGHSRGVFPPLDVSTFPSQLFWLFITFGFLLLFLAKVLLPRLGGILEDRSNKIANDLDWASRMQREAELAEKHYKTALKDARAKAHNVSETTRASITAEMETEMETANKNAIRALEAAEIKIKTMRAKALANVDDIAAQTARSLANKLFRGTVTSAAAKKAVKAAS
ncbi:MAG: hypothetical protein V3U57_08490 [Robiginitomaculum sp.]